MCPTRLARERNILVFGSLIPTGRVGLTQLNWSSRTYAVSKSIIVSGEKYLLRLSRYIHLNPVKVKLVSDLSHYLWSSYPSYIRAVVEPDWLHTSVLLNAYQDTYQNLRYKNFVEDNNTDSEITELLDSGRLPAVIGNEEFIKYIEEKISTKNLSHEIIAHKYLYTPLPADTILNIVAEYFGISCAEITMPDTKNTPRIVAIILCRETL